MSDHIKEIQRQCDESFIRSRHRRREREEAKAHRIDAAGIFAIAFIIVFIFALVTYLQGGALW